MTPEVQTWAQVSPWVASAAVQRAPRATWRGKFRAVLWVVDVAAVAVAATTTILFRFDANDGLAGSASFSYLWLIPALVVLWLLMLAAVDSRSPRVMGTGLEEYRLVLAGSLYLFGGLAIVSYALRADLARSLFITTLPLGAALLLLGRWVARKGLHRLRAQGRAMTQSLVIGTGSAVADVLRDAARNRNSGYQVAAACVLDGAGAQVAHVAPDLRFYSYQSIEHVIGQNHFGAVIVADGLDRASSRDLAWRLENRPTELMFVPRVMDVAGPRLTVRSMPGLSLVHVDLPKFTGWKQMLKRGFDIVFSVFALIVLSPVLAAVAIAIKLDDGGPVLFRQERVGRFGEPFTIHKFRTMCVDAEAKIDALIAAQGGTALLFKLENDPRITRIGNVLRKYSLDELPQFWSVLRGGMSVVGPRPQVAREVAEYTDIHHRRLLIKPGITGLWQVNGRSELSMEESIRLDLNYVENWSLVGDIVVILKTVRVVLRPSGAF